MSWGPPNLTFRGYELSVAGLKRSRREFCHSIYGRG